VVDSGGRFVLEGVELQKFEAWAAEHNKKCPFYDDGTQPSCPSGAIGGQYTYCFTPTGLGHVIVIECLCFKVHGNKDGTVNVTDFDSW